MSRLVIGWYPLQKYDTNRIYPGRNMQGLFFGVEVINMFRQGCWAWPGEGC